MVSYAGTSKGGATMDTIENQDFDNMIEKLLQEQTVNSPEGVEMELLFEAVEEKNKNPEGLIKSLVRDAIWRLIGKGRAEITADNLVKPI